MPACASVYTPQGYLSLPFVSLFTKITSSSSSSSMFPETFENGIKGFGVGIKLYSQIKFIINDGYKVELSSMISFQNSTPHKQYYYYYYTLFRTVFLNNRLEVGTQGKVRAEE